MRTVDDFLEEPLLDNGPAESFRRSRARVATRHRGWRANFPAIALLLDSDGERARALAGNYATQARETVGGWLAAHDASSDPAVLASRAGDYASWIEGYWDAWRRQVLSGDDFTGLDDVPRENFMEVFDDLMERFRDDAVAHVRTGPSSTASGGALVGALLRPWRAVGRGLRAFFFPGRPT